MLAFRGSNATVHSHVFSFLGHDGLLDIEVNLKVWAHMYIFQCLGIVFFFVSLSAICDLGHMPGEQPVRGARLR